MLIVVKKSLKIAKRSSEAKNQRRSDKMQKWPKEKRTKKQTVIYKPLYRELKIE